MSNKVRGEETFRDRLKAGGFRITPARLQVFRGLVSQSAPITIQQLSEQLAGDGLNMTTVYRVMEALVALGIAHPTLVGHQAVGYELREPFRPHHDHLMCRGCGKVIDIYDCALSTVLRTMSDQGGYQVDFHQADLHGLCPDCVASPALPL